MVSIRTLLALSLFVYPLFAENGGCFKFFPNSFKVIGGHSSYAVSKNIFVSFKCPTGKKVVSKDRFKGLCLFEDSAQNPLYLSDLKPPLYICPDKRVLKNPIESYPVSIFAGRLKERPGHEGAIFSGCCRLAAIFDSSGRWFGANDIRKLLKSMTNHSDIGVRFVKEDAGVVVESIDPYAGMELRVGDVLVQVGTKKNPTLESVRESVDGCRPKESLNLFFKRNGKSFKIEANCFERVGGGEVSDTFLERFGMEFSPTLKIVHIDPSSIAYKKGLREGDALLAIDGTKVESERDVREVLSEMAIQKTTPQNMLWERKEFQFFLLPTAL